MKRLKYVSQYVDNRGKTRYRFRKAGGAAGHFMAEPGTRAFAEEYALFLRGASEWERKRATGFKPGPCARYDYPDEPSVYFVATGRNVKIGWTGKPSRRLKELQVASPTRLKVMAVVPGSKSDEQALHEQFGHLNTSGEWHILTPELADHIERIRAANCLAPLSSNPERAK